MVEVFVTLKHGTVRFAVGDISPAVEYLKAYPDEDGAFVDAMLGVIHGQLDWRALKTARETFEAMCQVLEAVTNGPTEG